PALSRGPRSARAGRDVAALAAPPLGCDLRRGDGAARALRPGARSNAARRRPRLDARAGVARLLRPAAGGASSPGAPAHAPAARALAPRRSRVPALAGGTYGCSAGGRRHARAARDGLHAQPPAHDRRLVPHQAPAPRLATRRGALHGGAPRWPAVAEQRELAM